MTTTPFRKIAACAAILATAVACACLSSCGNDSPQEITVGSLRLIGSQVLPRRGEFGGTVVGGLSGIDYDEKSGTYVLISDDRTVGDSSAAPRMYTARLSFDANSFTGVQLLSTFSMRQPDGSLYPKVPDPRVADPESVRFDRASGNLLWTSEGDRTLANATTSERIINPFIREVKPDGTHVREYTLPSMFRMSSSPIGPRGNLAFEGLSFTPSNASAVVIAEGPLFDDGPTPTLTNPAVSRITVFDRASGTASAQYAYPIERVQVAPVPADAFTVNGPTEILALSETRFLVLERSFSVGVLGNQVRLYEIDVSKATNILNLASLNGATFTAVNKRLVLDFETIKSRVGGIANLEGITFGARLANGNRSLVVVADDNFPSADSATDFNQVLVFEVIP